MVVRRTTGNVTLRSKKNFERQLKAHFMQNLSPRHVKTEESLRLGVVSGWYSTKVSGTFVSGPHQTEEDCLRRIAEINPPPKPKKGAFIM
jgi:hypothetical protein